VLPQRLPVLPDRRRLFPGDRVFHDIPIGQFRERRRCLRSARSLRGSLPSRTSPSNRCASSRAASTPNVPCSYRPTVNATCSPSILVRRTKLRSRDRALMPKPRVWLSQITSPGCIASIAAEVIFRVDINVISHLVPGDGIPIGILPDTNGIPRQGMSRKCTEDKIRRNWCFWHSLTLPGTSNPKTVNEEVAE
jgi:hypothetical protein